MKNITKKIRIISGVLLLITMVSCAELEAVLQELPEVSSTALTTAEVARGLKEALHVGVDTAVSRLAKNNGYYGNADVRILLPPEADKMLDNIQRIPGGEELVEKLLRNINRSAEEAAKDAAPIFVNAITQMTIQDAWGILRGEQDAATNYLHSKTYNALYNLYQPKIKSATSREWVASISAQEAWTQLTSKWNTLAGSMVGQLAGFQKVEVDLDSYLTHQALNGMFLRVRQEEADIRAKTSARVTPLLRKVFSSSQS